MIVDLDGVPVFVYTGDGRPRPGLPPLILIHGSGMDHTVWRHLTPGLIHTGYPVFAIDLPGHGRSGGQPVWGIEAMATTVERLALTLGVERPVVVGHSMGALVALSMAGHDRVGAIALLGAAEAMPVNPALLAAARAEEPKAVDLIVKWSHVDRDGPGRHTDQAPPQGGRRMLEAGLRRSLASDLESCAVFTSGFAPGIDVPTLVIVADDDTMTPPAGADRLAAAIPGAIVRRVPTGHFALLDAPERVTEVLLEWLGDLFPEKPVRS